jgi:hypothetical protein
MYRKGQVESKRLDATASEGRSWPSPRWKY